ncbi:hypothetical protein [Sinorhizobium meliloti]|uniref:hypothetical protein n=1 Tax=Rhizobium meliloti TaxID=382 RepID=UPI003D64A422
MPANQRSGVQSLIAGGHLGHVTDDYVNWQGAAVFDCIVTEKSMAHLNLILIFPDITPVEFDV